MATSVASADVDLGDAAGELGDAPLELFLVIVVGGVVDLVLELIDAALDGPFGAGAFDDGGVVLIDADLLGPAELGNFDVFQLDAELFENRGAAGDDGDVFQHGFSAIAKARGFDGGDFEGAAELVHDEGREGLHLRGLRR